LHPLGPARRPVALDAGLKVEKVTTDPTRRLTARGTARRRLPTTALSILAVQVLCLALCAFAAAASPLTDVQRSWLSKANRHEKAGWVYLHIEGPARERGFQHGYLLATEIARGLKATRIEWEHMSAMSWTWLTGKAAAMFTGKIDAEDLAELDGIVEGLRAAGVSSSRAELIAYNGYIELNEYWWPEEQKKSKENLAPPVRQSCSSFVATGTMTAGGGVVLGHNTLMGYLGALPNVILDIFPYKGHRILMQSFPGWIHSGTDFFITDAGLVGAETTIGGFEGFDPRGVPEFVRMRRAMQDAGSIDEWCAIMKRGNNGGYANAWLLGDVNTGEIARLELGLKYVGFEKKRDGYFIGSNVAENLKILRLETDVNETDVRRSGVARRERWKQLMSEYAGKIDLAAAKRFEGDHFDIYRGEEHPGERSLCAHFELESDPRTPSAVPYEPGGVVDAKVVDSRLAKRMSIAARWGSGCGMAFDAQKFLKTHPQFEWMKDILRSRPSAPWTDFTAGEQR
jgi:hypothetical protein